ARVTVIDDLVRGRRENLAAAQASGRVELVEGDIRDAELVDELTRGQDLVFHQAALRITHCAEDPQRAVQTMVNGSQNVLDAAVRHKVEKVLAASSASVYGEPDAVPMTEDAPFRNRTLYGAAKIFDEQLLRAYAETYALRYVAIRPFNVYGPRMDVYGVYTEVMIRWLQRLGRGEPPVIFGDGLQTMDFIFVGDVARSYLCAATADATDIVCNAGTGIETTLRELCRRLCVARGRPEVEVAFEPPRKVNPVSRRLAATDLAADRLGFRATVGLDEGLNRLVAWYDTVAEVLSVA
ncbi:MAG: NAD-dependent epimerase/dehydratase family protein, partial [Candidatus Dormiibacterota bacterium]